MSYTLIDLAKAEKNVAIAMRLIATQQEVIAMMRTATTATEGAKQLLAQFEAQLDQARRIRDGIAAALQDYGPHARAA